MSHTWEKDSKYAPSGYYDILVGHASDDIRLTDTLQFTTAKVLPLHVDGSTTMGELFANPKTAPILGQMLQQAVLVVPKNNDESISVTGAESDQTMIEAMMNGMPLKSLMSFGILTADQIDSLIFALNSALQC